MSVEQQSFVPLTQVKFDRAALARYGLPAGAAAETLQTALAGKTVGQIFEGQVTFPLVVRYPETNIGDGGPPQHAH